MKTKSFRGIFNDSKFVKARNAPPPKVQKYRMLTDARASNPSSFAAYSGVCIIMCVMWHVMKHVMRHLEKRRGSLALESERELVQWGKKSQNLHFIYFFIGKICKVLRKSQRFLRWNVKHPAVKEREASIFVEYFCCHKFWGEKTWKNIVCVDLSCDLYLFSIKASRVRHGTRQC